MAIKGMTKSEFVNAVATKSNLTKKQVNLMFEAMGIVVAQQIGKKGPGQVTVPGLVKLVAYKDIEAADWSLSPGRYVGVAPPEEDEDFDFERTLRDIHTELADLNKEAAELASKIQENFEELGV